MAALISPYSGPADLMIDETDLILGETFDRDRVVNTAGRDIDAKLGFLYKLPLEPDPAIKDEHGNPITELPKHERDLLFSINNRLATGRILQGMKGSGDSTTQHSWGKQLIDEAETLLNMIASCDVELSAVRRDAASQSSLDTSRGPAIFNEDDVSMRRAFENQVFRNQPSSVYPGQPF